MQISTIGYEGAILADFIRALEHAHIRDVVDIRQRASSRRPGFSKTPLSTALRAAGIGYRHVQALGTPVALRRELAASGDYPRFFGCFAEYLATRSADIEELTEAMVGRIALLCFERDPQCCHRSLVAQSLSQRTGATVVHLAVTGGTRPL